MLDVAVLVSVVVSVDERVVVAVLVIVVVGDILMQLPQRMGHLSATINVCLLAVAGRLRFRSRSPWSSESWLAWARRSGWNHHPSSLAMTTLTTAGTQHGSKWAAHVTVREFWTIFSSVSRTTPGAPRNSGMFANRFERHCSCSNSSSCSMIGLAMKSTDSRCVAAALALALLCHGGGARTLRLGRRGSRSWSVRSSCKQHMHGHKHRAN